MIEPLSQRLGRVTSLRPADIGCIEALLGERRRLGAHTEVFKEGQASDGLHVLLDGWAARYRLLPDGRRQFTLVLLAGDVCDLDRLQVPRLESGLVTLTPCSVAVAPRSRLQALMDEQPHIRQAFWRLTVLENAMASERTVSLGRRSAAERLAHLFCELHLRLSLIGAVEDDSFLMPMRQEDLSDALGLSIVHVNRTMQGLRGAGLIRLAARRLRIERLQALRDFAGFDPTYLHLDDGATGRSPFGSHTLQTLDGVSLCPPPDKLSGAAPGVP
jgi:CRP-like cAMP-binding protein